MEEENNIDNENNVDLQSQLNELTNKLNDLTSENEKLARSKDGLLSDLQDKKAKLNEFQSKAQNEQEQEALKKGDIDFIVNQRLQSQKAEFEPVINDYKSQIENLSGEVNKYRSTIERNTVEQQLMKEIQNTDVQKTAIEDVIDYALRNSDIKEGKLIFKDMNGSPKTVNSRGEEYGVKDFFNEARNAKPHFFETKQGTNTQKGNGSNGVKEMTAVEYQKELMTLPAGSPEQKKLVSEFQAGNIIFI